LRPDRADIAAPELPGRLRWLNAERKPVLAELTALGPVLVHFFDFAQLNSVRALPYLIAWEERYREHGLVVLAIHSPRYPFTAERAALAPAIARLGVRHPVADDSRYGVWHDYGPRGWPALFLWAQGGALAWYHFGEGEYAATETAIQEELRSVDATLALPRDPLAPLRPSDAPGALVAPPSEELFPGGSAREPWRPNEPDRPLHVEYAAGGAHATLAGAGELRFAVDGNAEQVIEVEAPGLVDLAVHPRHSEHSLALHVGPGLELYSVSFSAGVP
jgi:hypothetical protein